MNSQEQVNSAHLDFNIQKFFIRHLVKFLEKLCNENSQEQITDSDVMNENIKSILNLINFKIAKYHEKLLFLQKFMKDSENFLRSLKIKQPQIFLFEVAKIINETNNVIVEIFTENKKKIKLSKIKFDLRSRSADQKKKKKKINLYN